MRKSVFSFLAVLHAIRADGMLYFYTEFCCPFQEPAVRFWHMVNREPYGWDCTMKRRIFTGMATALVTPMDGSGGIDYPALYGLLEFQIEHEADALVVMGTTGEASTLTDKEKNELAAFVIRRVDKRIPVILGTGSNDTRKAAALSREAELAGADGILLVTPYYNKTSQEGLIRHFETIADQVSLPVILYNVPTRTGVNICPETCRRLAKHPNICGLKEASGNISQVAGTAALCGDSLDIYSGNDDQILPVLSLGGQGVISVLGNIMPKETAELCRLFREGKVLESTALQLKLLPLMNAMFWDVNPIPVKAALSLMGMCKEDCRLPLVPLAPERKGELKVLMKGYGVL